MNKHCVVEIKLTSLATSDYLLLAHLWLSPALFVVTEKGHRKHPGHCNSRVGATIANKPTTRLQTLEGCNQVQVIFDCTCNEVKIELHAT